MSSRIEQATVALVALLDALGGITVTRNHDVPVDFVTESTPVLNVVDGDDTEEGPRFLPANTVEFGVDLVLAGYVTASEPADLGPARDALWLAVWKVLTTHRVLVNGSDELTWDVQPGKTERALESEPGKPVAVFRLPVTLRIKAQASDPAVAA